MTFITERLNKMKQISSVKNTLDIIGRKHFNSLTETERDSISKSALTTLEITSQIKLCIRPRHSHLNLFLYVIRTYLVSTMGYTMVFNGKSKNKLQPTQIHCIPQHNAHIHSILFQCL